ncbi:MAG: hypothetical protein M0C28_06880 [Candidatus Moduliflexus flocculans]|nr:hypothetical protein [Candidatus Moduliflexus flocculans]
MSRFRRSPVKTAVLLICAALVVLTALSVAQTKAAKPKVLQSTSPELRFKGFEEYKAMQAASKFKDLKWQFVGPTNVSGRVTDVAVVAPKGKNYTIYVASASGGVWKTENEGTTWTPIFENMVTAAIGDIALAPSDQNIVWVGTGEHNIFRSSQAGVGVFKSVDGGKTWAHMGLADTNTIARIVVHPTDPDIVYVAAGGHEWTKNADRGVYKTTGRRQDVGEGPLRQRRDRGLRPGHGPALERHPLRRHVAEDAPEMERPADLPGPHRERPLQDDRRRQDLDAHQRRAPGGRVPRPHRARPLPDQARHPLRPRRQLRAARDDPGGAGLGAGLLRSRQGLHQGRHGLPLRRRRGHLDADERPDSPAEVLHAAAFRHLRLGLRPDPGRSQRPGDVLHHGRAVQRLGRRRQDLQERPQPRAATTTPCGSTRPIPAT